MGVGSLSLGAMRSVLLSFAGLPCMAATPGGLPSDRGAVSQSVSANFPASGGTISAFFLTPSCREVGQSDRHRKEFWIRRQETWVLVLGYLDQGKFPNLPEIMFFGVRESAKFSESVSVYLV